MVRHHGQIQLKTATADGARQIKERSGILHKSPGLRGLCQPSHPADPHVDRPADAALAAGGAPGLAEGLAIIAEQVFPAGFPGLAQLGVYSIAGLLAAALTARCVLPGLLPAPRPRCMSKTAFCRRIPKFPSSSPATPRTAATARAATAR